MKRLWMMVPFGVLALLCGCAPGISLDPALKTYSRAELEDMDEIEMPANYSIENFRKLQMGVAFEVLPGVDAKTGAPLLINPGLSKRLEGEMSKLKRFAIFSMHNRGGVTFFQEVADVDGQVNLREATNVKDIDLILTASLRVTKNRIDRYNDTILIYEVSCDVSCEDLKTRTVKFSETARGRTARKVLLSYTGKLRAGFDEADEQQAIEQAATKALASVANKLGNTFPVGGAVSGITASGERMTMKAGSEEGIGDKQQCVIFVDDGGVDVPIALAKAAPKNNGTSALAVYRWAKTADAKPLVRELRENGRVFLRHNKVYAVGYGLSVPPAWSDDKMGAQLEELNLK